MQILDLKGFFYVFCWWLLLYKCQGLDLMHAFELQLPSGNHISFRTMERPIIQMFHMLDLFSLVAETQVDVHRENGLMGGKGSFGTRTNSNIVKQCLRCFYPEGTLLEGDAGGFLLYYRHGSPEKVIVFNGHDFEFAGFTEARLIAVKVHEILKIALAIKVCEIFASYP